MSLESRLFLFFFLEKKNKVLDFPFIDDLVAHQQKTQIKGNINNNNGSHFLRAHHLPGTVTRALGTLSH